jgi:hypothetical protein
MGEFNPKLDKNLFKEVVEVGDMKLAVGVYAYNEGQPKLQIRRSRKNPESEYGWSFAKLGRLTKDELEAILPHLEIALDMMNQ